MYWLYRGTENSHQGCLEMLGSDRVLVTRGVSDAQRHQEEARGFSLALAKQRVELERAQDKASKWRSEVMSLQTRVACAEERVQACGELIARDPTLQYNRNLFCRVTRVGGGGVHSFVPRTRPFCARDRATLSKYFYHSFADL